MQYRFKDKMSSTDVFSDIKDFIRYVIAKKLIEQAWSNRFSENF